MISNQILQSTIEGLKGISRIDFLSLIHILKHWDVQKIYVPEYKEELARQLSFAYPYEKEGKLKLKFTVSELKKRSALEEEAGEVLYEEADAVPLVPQFLNCLLYTSRCV